MLANESNSLSLGLKLSHALHRLRKTTISSGVEISGDSRALFLYWESAEVILTQDASAIMESHTHFEISLQSRLSIFNKPLATSHRQCFDLIV